MEAIHSMKMSLRSKQIEEEKDEVKHYKQLA